MPYSIIKKDGKFCLQKDDDRSIVKGSCHKERSETESMMAAILANEKKSMKEDTLIYFGDAVKALDDSGRVGGYLVRFTDAKHKDLDGEYFTAETDYGPSEGNGDECLFDHGYVVPANRFIKDLSDAEFEALEMLADRTFAPLKTKRDAVGIFAETVLNLEDEYEKFIHNRVKKGKIGWSSAAPSHRVKRADDGWLSRWPIAEGSLTPRPAEPLNRAVAMKSFAAMKFLSLTDEGEDGDGRPATKPTPFTGNALARKLNKHIDELIDEGHSRDEFVKQIAAICLVQPSDIEAIFNGSIQRPPDVRLKAVATVLNIDFTILRALADRDASKSIKGIFEDALAERSPSTWELWNTFCSVITKLATVAESTESTGVAFDLEKSIDETLGELVTRLRRMVLAQIQSYVEDHPSEPFYLKAIIDLSSDLPVSGNLDLSDHSQLVVSALRDVVKRFRANHEGRKRGDSNHKAGRVLSQRNRERLSAMLDSIQAAVSDCQSLLEESQPMADDTEKRAAQTAFLRLESLGASTN